MGWQSVGAMKVHVEARYNMRLERGRAIAPPGSSAAALDGHERSTSGADTRGGKR